MCHSAHRVIAGDPYTRDMNPYYTKVVSAAAVWALAICAAGLAAGIPPVSWAATSCVALLPGLVIVRFWNHQIPSLSVSIQKAIR